LDQPAGNGLGNEFKMTKTSPVQFMQQVRQEVAKVTWPTRKETLVTTAMVFVMGVVAAIFFLLVDQVLSVGIKLILGLGN
jgi:preprotein translocase subunit SecE